MVSEVLSMQNMLLIEKKACRNSNYLNVEAETSFPGGSKFENFILILQLVFEPEQFELSIGISIFCLETFIT